MKQKNKLSYWVTSSKRYVSGLLAGVLLSSTFIIPTTQVEAHDGYFLAILPNITNLSYQSIVIQDKQSAEKDHLEFKFLGGTSTVSPEGGKLDNLPTSLSGFRDDNGNLQDKFTDNNGDETYCMFTWPTCQTTKSNWSWVVDSTVNWAQDVIDKGAAFFGHKFFNEGNATNEDRLNAARVGKELTQGVNTALAYIAGNLHKDGEQWVYNNSKNKEDVFFQITGKFANAARNAQMGSGEKRFEIDEIDSKFEIFTVSDDEAKSHGLDTDGYIYLRIKEDKDKTRGKIFLASTPRYKDVTDLAAYVKGATLRVDLFQIIALGNAAYAAENVEVTKLEALYEPSLVEGIMYDIINTFLQGLRDFLGTSSFGELVFNEGVQSFGTFAGLAPETWFQAADVIFWVAQIFAWLILAFATMRFLGLHMWSTITPLSRVSLMNGIQNTLITAFFLTMIVPIFNVIANFNYLIVDILRDTSMFNEHVLNGQLFPGTLSGVILAGFFFVAELIINFIYILRGFTICLLYGLSPVFVAAFALGGRYQTITMKFIKELVGNIFIQTFHAIILTFYGLFVYVGGSSSFLISLALAFAFLPLTKLFKEIVGIGESNFIGGIAGQTGGAITSAMKGAATGPIDGALDSKGGHSHNHSQSQNQNQNESSSSNSNTHSTTQTTPTKDVEQEKRLASPQENVSLNESMAPSSSLTASADDSVMLDNGGGSVNSFGEHVMNRSQESSESELPEQQPRSAGRNTLSSLYHGGAALGRGALSAGFGALGGLTGISTFNRLSKMNGQKMAQHARKAGRSGLDATKQAGHDLQQSRVGQGLQRANFEIKNAGHQMLAKYHELKYGQMETETPQLLISQKACDFDMNKNACATECTYDNRIAEDSGILQSYEDTIDGRDYIVQEYSQELVNEVLKDLPNIKFDPTTGKVTDEESLKRGIHYISKTEDGRYAVALDQEALGVKSYHTASDRTRHTVKMKGDNVCEDMNFTKYALNK